MYIIVQQIKQDSANDRHAMRQAKSGRGPGRPRDLDKRAAIVEAAWSAFLAEGVQGASLDRIARSAGVSRVTLYSHFLDKASLFEETIRKAMERLALTQQSVPRGEALRGGLIRFGEGLMRFLIAPEAASFYAVLAGELRRNPALARSFYEAGPAVTLRNLAEILEDAHDRGQLIALDPAEAAEQLMGLWAGAAHYRIALGVDLAELEAAIPQRVAASVDLFLAARAPTPGVAAP